MAIIELQKSSTRASGDRMGLAFLTTTRAKPCDNPVHEHPSVRRNGPRILTGAVVEAEERGDEEVANEARPIGPAARQRAQRAPQYDSEAARRRSELARDLLGRTEQMMPLIGDPGLAVNIRLLKNNFAGCHDRLKDSPSESDLPSWLRLSSQRLLPGSGKNTRGTSWNKSARRSTLATGSRMSALRTTTRSVGSFWPGR